MLTNRDLKRDKKRALRKAKPKVTKRDTTKDMMRGMMKLNNLLFKKSMVIVKVPILLPALTVEVMVLSMEFQVKTLAQLAVCQG